jgi:hypothetical protein
MAADPANGTVVLFGGPGDCDSSTCTDQTWTWDGTQWTLRHPRNHPSARGNAAMAYDPATRTVVLFGGWTADFTPLPANPPHVVYFDDTWTWDGRDWTQQHPAVHPDARFTDLATDPATHSVLLQGGQHKDPQVCPVDPVGCLLVPVFDTWTWDGTDWTQQHPATQPTTNGTMASDPATRTVVAFGGGSSVFGPVGDTWTWDGRDWTQQHPAHQPTPVTLNGLAYDPASGTVVLFSGAQAPFPAVNGDTWTWNGTDWTQQHLLPSPSPRKALGLATDPATCSVVLFGGIDTSLPHPVSFGDTWAYTSSQGDPDQFEQQAATQHEHEGSPNCSPRED